MRTKQTIAKKLRVSDALIWDAISAVGRLDVWFPIIETCRIDGQGKGAIRRMTVVDDGGEIEDTIEDVDTVKKKLVYQRLVTPLPVSSYRGTVEVMESFDGLGVIVWTVDFDSKPEDAQSLADFIRDAISDGIDGMEADLRERADKQRDS